MSKPKILFPDTLHFHGKNFRSLLLTEKFGYEAIFIKKNNHLKGKYGNYQDVKTTFLEYYDHLFSMKLNDLFEVNYHGAHLFPLVKAELLSFLLPKENWIKELVIKNDDFGIFEKSFLENKEDLILNLSVGMFWLDFWKDEISKYKNVKECAVFSGSLSYVKTLSYLLQNTPVRVHVVEHFLTGSDYYFEEKYTHIANNSDIKFPNVYQKLKQEFDALDDLGKLNERTKSINKMLLMDNKNVKQPIKSEDIQFELSGKTILIVGQVINDFSIIETQLRNINSFQVYIKLINNILIKTDLNIIFKAHPWERSKININYSLTKEKLLEFLANDVSPEHRKRVRIVEEHNIKSLIQQSDYVSAMCSQALIEATYLGKKTFQFGKAFYGGKGFTYDCMNEDELVNMLEDKNLIGDVSFHEYQNFLEFITIQMQFNLVSIHDSGLVSLRKKLATKTLIKTVIPDQRSLLSPSVKKINEENTDSAVAYIDLDFDAAGESSKPVRKKMVEGFISLVYSGNQLKKFKHNPEQFFNDSAISAVRIIGKLYLK